MATHPKLGRVQIAILARTRWSHPDQRNNAILEATREGDASLIASAPDMAKEIAQLKADRAELVCTLDKLIKAQSKRDMLAVTSVGPRIEAAEYALTEIEMEARALIAKHSNTVQ